MYGGYVQLSIWSPNDSAKIVQFCGSSLYLSVEQKKHINVYVRLVLLSDIEDIFLKRLSLFPLDSRALPAFFQTPHQTVLGTNSTAS